MMTDCSHMEFQDYLTFVKVKSANYIMHAGARDYSLAVIDCTGLDC